MKPRRLLLSIGIATLFGCLLLLVKGDRAAKAIEAPQDVTFEGTFDDDPAVTVTLALTSDRSGITRAGVEGFTTAILRPDGGLYEIYFSGQVYFASPRSVTNGAFDIGVPGDEALGGPLSSMRLEGNVATESDTLEGTATLCLATPPPGTPCTPATLHSPFTATRQSSPGQPERLIVGEVVDRTGHIILSTDETGESINAVSLKDVLLQGCPLGDPSTGSGTTVRIPVEPPQPASSFQVSARVRDSSFFVNVEIDGGVSGDSQARGTLAWSDVGYHPPCRETFTFTWTTVAETPTAIATPTATPPTQSAGPALPPVGNGPPRDGSAPIVLLAVLVIASALLVTFSLAGRRADQDN